MHAAQESEGAAPGSGPSPHDHLVIFAVSFSLLVFQIALTRVLSVVVWYHFAFLTISAVMLGVGAPGLWFALVHRPLRFLPFCLLSGGLLVPAAVIVIVQAGALLMRASVLGIIVAVLPAMLALGASVCLLLMKAQGKALGRMYAADLMGACLGALAVIPLLHVVPTPLLACLCGLPSLFSLFAYGRAWRWTGAAAATLVLLATTATDSLVISRTKRYSERSLAPLLESWTPLARLTVFDRGLEKLVGQEGAFVWGRGSAWQPPPVGEAPASSGSSRTPAPGRPSPPSTAISPPSPTCSST